MSEKNLWQRIKEKNANALDPIDRISEVLFGLIMVLSFTGSISVVSDGRAEISELTLGSFRLQPCLGNY